MTISVSETSQHLITSDINEAHVSDSDAHIGSEHARNRRRWTHAWIAAFSLAVLAAAAWFSWSSNALAWWSGIRATAASPDHFRVWIQGFGVWGPAIYFVAEVVQVVVPPIPGSIFPPVAAAAFGADVALALTMAGTTVGSAIVFVLARKWGRPLLEHVVSPQTIDKYAGILTARGGLWLFVIMLVPFLPDDAVCAMAGSTAISFPRFIILTTLGRLPSTLLGIYLVATPVASPATLWLPAALIVLIPFTLGIRYRGRLEGWVLHRSCEDA